MKPTKFLSEAVALCGAMAISFTSVLAASPASASAQLGPEAKAKQTAAAKAALDKAEIFYTGKPYDADAQEYIFAARNYDPTVARWTSVDPSGFPDGANNRIYTTTPNKQLDPDGKAIIFLSPLDYFSPSIVAAAAEWNYLEAGALATGNLMIVDSMLHAESGQDWTLSSPEITTVKNTNTYSQFYNNVQGQLNSDPYNYAYSSHYTFPIGEAQPHFSIGGCDLSTSAGNVSYTGDIWFVNATVTLNDHYQFGQYPDVAFWRPTGAGYTLQTAGYIHTFNTIGTWNESWLE